MNPSNNGRKQFIVVRPTAQINSPRAATYIAVPSSPIHLQQISANNVNPVRLLGQMIVQPQQIGVRQILMTSPVSSSPAVGSPNGSINIRQISPLPRVTFTSRRAKKPLLSKVHAKSEETQEAKVACPNCGIAATNFQICRRCKKFVNTTPKPTLKITSSNKIIVDGINATMREIENKTRGIPSTSFYSNGKGESDFARYLRASEQGSSKAPVTRKRPLLTRVTKVPENDCITISSDSEDEAEPSNNSLSESSSTIGQPNQASGQTDADEETPTKRLKLEKKGEDHSQPSKPVPASPLSQSTVRTDEEISRYALNIFIDSIRIGQEKLTPQSVLRMSQENINASAHSVATKQGLILDIKWSNIDSCELCSDRREPCMYLKISHGSLPDLRETLGMEKGVNPYYDPNGPVEEKFFIIYFNSGFLNSSSQCSIDIIERKINLIRKKLKKPSTFFSKISYTESNYRQTVVAEIEAEESPASSQMEDTAKQSNEVSTSTVSQPITVLPHLRMVTRNQTSNVTKVTPISPVDDQLTFIFSGPRIELFVYPPPPAKGGISVTNEDQFCLNEGVFLNDKIIEFYLKYVYSRILSNEDQNRSHIFSCFFYERLMQKCKKVRDINAAERRHSQVKKWTRNIDIFSKDFIFIPINEASHWYLAVVCFPYLVHEIVEITRASGKKEILPLIACKAGDGFTAKSSKISSELAKVHTRGDKEQGSQQDYDQSEPRSESNSPVLERRRPMISVTLPNFTIRKKITKPHDVAKSNQNDDSSVDIANINSNNTCSHGDKESEHSSQEVLERTEDKDMHGTDKEDDHCDKHICKQQSQERGHLAILDSGSGYRSETKEIPLESGPVSCNETSNSDTSPSNCEVKHFSSPSKDVQKRQEMHDSVDVCVRTSCSNPENSKSNVVELLGHTDSGNSDSKISGDDAEKHYKLYVDPGGIDFTLSKELKQQCTVSPIKPLVVLPKVKNVTPVKLKPETVIHNVPSSDESMILVSSPDCSDVDAKKLSKTVSPSGQLVECNSVVPATPITPLILKLETSSHELSDCGDVSKRPFKKITPLYRAEKVSSLGVGNEASSQLEEHKHRALSDPEDVSVSKNLFSPEKDFEVEPVAQTTTTVSTVESSEENIPSNSESVVCSTNSEEASNVDQNVENDNKSDGQALDKPNMDTQTTTPSGSLESSESGDKDEKDSRNQKDEGDEDDRVIKRMYKRPCILVFDSLRGPSRSKIASSLREYLSMEWKTRKEKEFGLKTFDKDSLKMCSVVVPQQDNYTDCGVFLLHYVEKFFSNPVQSFSLPIKELENWFDPNECKKKREDIKKVIDDLHEDWLARTITEES